jgi:hypothetical protein
VTEQLADAPLPLSVHVLLLKLPAPPVPPPLRDHETFPVGVLVLPVEVSVTVAVQVVAWFRPVGLGKQLTAVLVARLLTVKDVLVVLVRPGLEAARV